VRYLIDTEWVIHYLNGRPDIVARILDLGRHGIAMSMISLAELYEGVFYSREPRRSEEALQDFLRGIELLGIDDEIIRVFGLERGRLRAEGKTIGDFDLLIGATGLQRGLTVLTNNRRHFELIAKLQNLST
jgi:tRNA(fMet)-specific endonuclease VapC